MWYEEGEVDRTTATFRYSEAKGRYCWDLERIVDHVPVSRPLASKTLAQPPGDQKPSRLKRIASKIKVGGLENVHPSASARTAATSSSPISPRSSLPALSRISSSTGSTKDSSPLSPAPSLSRAGTRRSRQNTPTVSTAPSGRGSPTKTAPLPCDSLAILGLGIKPPKTRELPVSPTEEAIRAISDRFSRHFRPEGSSKLFLTAPLDQQRTKTVIVYDSSGPNAGTLQCLLEELLNPLFAVQHEATTYFRQLLAGGLTYGYRLMLSTHLMDRYSHSGEKERTHILALFGEWMKRHPEDFQVAQELNQNVNALYFDALRSAIEKQLTKQDVEQIKAQSKFLKELNAAQAVYRQQNVASPTLISVPNPRDVLLSSSPFLSAGSCIFYDLNVRIVAQYLAASDLILFRHSVTARNSITNLRNHDRKPGKSSENDRALLDYQRRGSMISHWVVTEILIPPAASERAVIIAHFIDLATFLLSNGDGETAYHVFCGLVATEVKVKSSWAMVDDTQLLSFATSSRILSEAQEYKKFLSAHKRPVIEVCSGNQGLFSAVKNDWKQAQPYSKRMLSIDTSAVRNEYIQASTVLPYQLDNGIEHADLLELLPVRQVLSRIDDARGRCKKPHDFGTLSPRAYLFRTYEPTLGSIPGSGTPWNPRQPMVNPALEAISEPVEKRILFTWELRSDSWTEGSIEGRTKQEAAVAKLAGVASWQELKHEHSPDVIRESKNAERARLGSLAALEGGPGVKGEAVMAAMEEDGSWLEEQRTRSSTLSSSIIEE